MSVPTLDGITSQQITTSRISTRVLFNGPDDGVPVMFIHGNLSSATYWEEVMLALPDGYRAIAYDQRGYGDADPAVKIDATRGMGDLSDDAFALADHLGIDKFHVAGHSMGGSVIWRMMIDNPGRLLTVTVAAPGSPYGFGGSKGLDGAMCFPDGAGSGGAVVNADFAKLIGEGHRDDGEMTPRFVMNNFYWKPPFKPAREEDLLSSMLSAHIGPEDYPGDLTGSENWPTAAPGKLGVANALSPLYRDDVNKLYAIDPKPPVLWVRGADDQIISDNSMFDVGMLGKLGAVPGWPGDDVFPPQPMVSQTRAVLEKYGAFEEVVLPDTAHSPFIEKPAEFNAAFHKHIGAS